MAPAYTHGHAESVLRSHRTRTAANSAAYLLGELRPGQALLDIGSGPGTITADLARLVAPGRVTALETSDEIVALTRTGITGAGVENVDYLVGDVHALDLPDDSFDVVHAHQVLQHLPDPVQALREMVRVCRPGGVVAVRDADYEAFTWYPTSPWLDRWLALYRDLARRNDGEPDAGRRLLSWALAAGADPARVTATASVWCYADDESRTAWGLGWADRIVHSAVASQSLAAGLATPTVLNEIANAWRTWAATPDGWFTLLHGELLIRV
ncbi:methyltransferase domain-containing protein [Micropruina sp.]|uniref:methyltransferase domain-containing protein n=1 Tax=Micropruina sp. TaxID=2737536 RepID=UPI0039E23F70